MFTVQGMDVRTTEVQTIRTSGFVVDVTPEVQTVTVGNSDFRLSFRGLKLGVTLGTNKASEEQNHAATLHRPSEPYAATAAATPERAASPTRCAP